MQVIPVPSIEESPSPEQTEPSLPCGVQEEAPAASTRLHGLPLRINFSWTLAGNVVYTGCQFVMSMVIAKLGSKEMLGSFTYGLAITAPIVMLSNLGLRGLQATDAREQFTFRDYLGLRMLTTLLALLAILGIAVWGHRSPEQTLVIIAIGFAKSFESISDVVYGLMQHHERLDRMAMSMMIKGPLGLLALGVAIYFTRQIFWGAAGMAAAWLALLLLFDYRNGRYILGLRVNAAGGGPEALTRFSVWPRWQLATLRELAWLGLPLGVVAMLISWVPNIPRVFVERYRGLGELGIYAAMSYLLVAGTTIVQALGNSASPRLSHYYADGNVGAFRSLMFKLMGIAAGLGGAAIVLVLAAGKPILALLYRPEYARYPDVFLLLVVAACLSFIASFLGYGMTAARYLVVQLPLFILVTGTTFIACKFLVPAYGLKGAAWAQVISMAVQALSAGVVIWHALARRRREKEGSVQHELA